MINWIKEKILNKKFLGICFIIINALLVGAFFIFYLDLPKWIIKMGMPKPLPEEEIQEILPTLKRTYPDVIKGNWEPSSFYMNKMITKDSDELRDLGVNTVSVTPEYEFNANGTYDIFDEELAKSNIILAKQEGFAVFLAPNFVGGDLRSFSEKGTDITLEEYLAVSDKEALKWAQIAEEFNVEYFSPQSELDYILQVNFEQDRGKKAQILAAWHKQILPQVREIYSGEILTKFGWIDEAMTGTASDYTGYDYIGIVITHGNNNPELYREVIKQGFKNASDLSLASNSKWLVAEAWFAFGTDRFKNNSEGESLDELQDNYIKIATEEYLEIEENKPVGYIFHSWIMPESKIKDRDAEDVMKEFFSEL